MPETEPTRARWKRCTHSISTKLIALLLASLVVIFSLLGYLNIRLQQRHLEAATLTAAERVSDVIRRSTAYYMLRNDREGLYHTIQTMADEPGMVKVRIIDRDGRITYSTDSSELNRIVDKRGEACYGCHAQSQPLSRLDRPDRFRIYRNGGGKRVLGIITPIENQPRCSNGPCHAHPASQQVLGVLDTNLSLAKADAQLAENNLLSVAYTLAAMLIVAALSWVYIVRVVGKPIRELAGGTDRLARGDLGFQIEVRSLDELGDLARSFNGMSMQLDDANRELMAWNKMLERRIVEKTSELKKAYEHVLLVEKMATVGKMAAVVAHEINNPLAGILTYAKLMRKWVDRGDMKGEKLKEAGECLDLIGGESRRCGDIVRNLLTFSRTVPMNVETVDVNMIIDRAVRLVHHRLELDGIELQLHVDDTLPKVHCDSAQIEQVLLALIMNAIDAMPHGGNLWLRTAINQTGDGIEIEVRDDGIGISPEVLPHIFEPFQTTKEPGQGVGLGLAISHSIIERHQGRIEVDSQLGKGTVFKVVLPVDPAVATEREFVEAAKAR